MAPSGAFGAHIMWEPAWIWDLREEGACHRAQQRNRPRGHSAPCCRGRAVAKWVGQSAERLGGVYVVVSNASALGGIPHMVEGWRLNFEVDVMSAVTLVDAAVPGP